MSPRLLFAVVFIEGYCSLGAEVIALRRLIPHIGSSIVVTAPTIGFFLFALALGYHSGGRIAGEYRVVVARNFLLASALMGIGLAGSSVDALFAGAPAALAWLLFVTTVVCPLAWLLGQTVPILTNLMHAQRSGEAAGGALYWSTLGSFLGSVSLSLGMMQAFGVWSAVLLGAALLLLGCVMVQTPHPMRGLLLLVVAAVSVFVSLGDRQRSETAYADYAVTAVEREDMEAPRAFRVNSQTASLLDRNEPPRYARYIEHLRHILLTDRALRDKEILVLGAGGFTLSHRETTNRYTYVDIDPAIRELAERDFLKEPIRGQFVVGDARRYVAETPQRYDSIVVDVFTARTAIPGHLVTREFWRDVRRALKPDGLVLVNLILDSRLETRYARNALATIEAVYGRCAVEVLTKATPLSNVVVSCFATRPLPASQVYVDERNRADIDAMRDD